MKGGQIDRPPPEKTTFKKPALLGLTHRKTTVSFTEASLILKLNYQFLSRGLPAQSCLCEF